MSSPHRSPNNCCFHTSSTRFPTILKLSFSDSKLHLQSSLTDLNQRAQKFIYASGKKQQPTAIDYEKSLLEDFLFNRTPSKVR